MQVKLLRSYKHGPSRRTRARTQGKIVRALSSSGLISSRRKRRALGPTKVSPCGNTPETSFAEDRDSCGLKHDTSDCKMVLLSTKTVRIG